MLILVFIKIVKLPESFRHCQTLKIIRRGWNSLSCYNGRYRNIWDGYRDVEANIHQHIHQHQKLADIGRYCTQKLSVWIQSFVIPSSIAICSLWKIDLVLISYIHLIWNSTITCSPNIFLTAFSIINLLISIILNQVAENAISTLFELKLTSSACWLSNIFTDGNPTLDRISFHFSFNADNTFDSDSSGDKYD